MLDFIYENKSEIIFGKHKESVIASKIKKFGGSRVMIHYGQSSAEKSGLLGKIKNALEAAKISYILYGGVRANPYKDHADKGIDIARSERVDFVLAVGGGSVIDSAKYIAAGVLSTDIWDSFKGNSPINKALPIGVVLTIPAAGSEGSSGSVIKDEQTGLKYSTMAEPLRPKFAFINPENCFTLPQSQIAYGASDILAHLMERYFSPLKNVEFTDKLLTAAMQAIMDIAPKVYNDPNNYEYWAEFCHIGTLAHNGMLDMGREVGDWASHRIENILLSGIFDIAHGAGLAIIYPAVLKHNAKANPEKVIQFAEEVLQVSGKDNDEKIKKAIAKLEEFYKKLELNITLSEAGIDFRTVQAAAEKYMTGYSALGGYSQLTCDDIMKIIELAK